MAIATKPAPFSSPRRNGETTAASLSLVDRLVRLVDSSYRFLASVKLAVLTLGTLAATLAYATFFESRHGTAAVQEYIYRSPGFAILLAFLGINILCAALIRFPWKKRQTGFVVTHAGLLILLVGSYIGVRTADEGQVGMLEGQVKSELVRIDYPVIRVREIDPHSQGAGTEYALPFRPGPFEWGPAKPKDPGLIAGFLRLATLGIVGKPTTREVLTQKDDPFQLVVVENLPAAGPAVIHVADPEGAPMARITLNFKAPGMPQARDAFASEDDHWFVTERKFQRVVRDQRPAMITFSHVDRPDLVDDFLKPPPLGVKGSARFRYADREGKARTYDWALDGQEGKSITLPDSPLEVTLSEITEFPTAAGGLERILGDDPVPIAIFKIHAGKDEPVTHMALANLPMVPNVIPSADPAAGKRPAPLAQVHYMVAPRLDPKGNGRFGQIEILAGPDGSLYQRVFGRGKETTGELRSSGPLEKGKPIVAFGGNPNLPMTISFQLDDYLPAGVEKQIYEPVVLPKAQMGNGIAACRAEMTVGGQTKEIWLSRSENLDPPSPRHLAFGDRFFELVYDVDRKPLGFELKLDDFDTGFEPGTEQATHFESKVRLTDPEQGIKDKPYTIWMNHPLDHRGYTFYQSNYIRERDPRTHQFTGQFQSVFQVAANPGRPIIYSGCLLVVIGAFLQFYMRAGIFTDGGKKEREKKAKAKESALAKAGDDADPAL